MRAYLKENDLWNILYELTTMLSEIFNDEIARWNLKFRKVMWIIQNLY